MEHHQVRICIFIGTQPRPYVLSLAAFILQWQNWVVVTDYMWCSYQFRLLSDKSHLITSECCTTNHSDAVVTWQHFKCHEYWTVTILFYFFIPSTDPSYKNKKKREEWSLNVAILGHNGVCTVLLSKCKSLCLLCSDIIAVLKKYNIYWHYQSKFSSLYSQLTEKQWS